LLLEEQVRFVEKEDEPWLLDVADLGQIIVETGQHPHHERREQGRARLQILKFENADPSAPIGRELQEVVEIELRLPEENLRTLLFELDHLAEQHAHRGLRHASVLGEVRSARARQMLEDGPQVGEVEESEPLVVTVLEDEAQDTRLGLVESEHLREQQRTKGRDGGPQLGSPGAGQAEELHGVPGGAP
jgi:hypothetical protein